jgi:hypothetical protein
MSVLMFGNPPVDTVLQNDWLIEKGSEKKYLAQGI